MSCFYWVYHVINLRVCNIVPTWERLWMWTGLYLCSCKRWVVDLLFEYFYSYNIVWYILNIANLFYATVFHRWQKHLMESVTVLQGFFPSHPPWTWCNTGVLCDPRVVVVADFVDQFGFRALGFRNLATVERTGIYIYSFKSSETPSRFTDCVDFLCSPCPVQTSDSDFCS